MSPGPIRMAVFDADQTLWDFHHGMRRALGARIIELRERFPGAADLTLDDLVADREAIAREHPDLFDLTEVRRRAFARTVSRFDGPADLADELLARFFAERLRPDDVFHDVVPALRELRDAGVRLAVCTNGNNLIDDAGLGDWFEVVIYAADVGAPKPERAIFTAVEEAAGLGPDELVMVGDDPVPDVVGAINAGWRAVWVDRERRPWLIDDVSPTARVDTFAELPGVLLG